MDGLEKDTALLKGIAEHAGLTPAALARRARVAVTTINRPFSGISTHRLSQPTLDKLRSAFADYPGWNAYLRGDDDPDFIDQGISMRHRQRPSGVAQDLVELDEVDLRYGMGSTFAEGHIAVEKRPFSREWLRSIKHTAPQHLSWAIGDGDSMEPTIRSGEVILIDRSLDTPRMDDGIWAVVHGEIGMIKRLRQLPDGTVELHSDNQLVRPQIAVDGELHVVGRVVAVVRRL